MNAVVVAVILFLCVQSQDATEICGHHCIHHVYPRGDTICCVYSEDPVEAHCCVDIHTGECRCNIE